MLEIRRPWRQNPDRTDLDLKLELPERIVRDSCNRNARGARSARAQDPIQFRSPRSSHPHNLAPRTDGPKRDDPRRDKLHQDEHDRPTNPERYIEMRSMETFPRHQTWATGNYNAQGNDRDVPCHGLCCAVLCCAELKCVMPR